MSHIAQEIEHLLDPNTVKVHVANAKDITTVDRIAEWGAWVTYPITPLNVGGNAVKIMPQAALRRRAVIAVPNLVSGGSAGAAASATGPTAGTVIASIPATKLSPGTAYTVTGSVYTDGTLTAADQDNYKLVANGVTISNILDPNVASAQSSFGPFQVVFGAGTTNISVQALNNAGVAAVYHAQLIATPVDGVGSGVVIVGGREQVMNGQGGQLASGSQITIESEEDVWAVSDGISTGIIVVLDERYSEYEETTS